MPQLWDNDLLQFARLIAETEALGGWCYDSAGIPLCHELEEAMDLSSDEINQLVDRAQKVWDEAKEDSFRDKYKLSVVVTKLEAAEGAYWYYSDHHMGQGSPEYQCLCAIEEVFTPGRLDRFPKSAGGKAIYRHMMWRAERRS